MLIVNGLDVGCSYVGGCWIRQGRQALPDEAEYQRFKEMAAKEKRERAYGAAVAYFIKKQL